MEVASEGPDSGISAQAAEIDWGISLESDSKVRLLSQSISLMTFCDSCLGDKKSVVSVLKGIT